MRAASFNNIGLFNGWHAIDGPAAVGLLIGIIGILVGFIPIMQSRRAGKAALREACQILKEHIRDRMDTPALMTATSIRGLAKGVQLRSRSPVITDAEIANVLRDYALDEEARLPTGKKLVERLRIIDEILKEIDESGPRLLSVASVDRMRAYAQSIFAIGLTTFFVQVLLAQHQFYVFTIAVWALNLVYIWIIITAIRAWQFWRNSPDRRTNAVFDFFFIRARSHDFSVHGLWAPIWEELFFRVIIVIAIPLFAFFTLPSLVISISPKNRAYSHGIPTADRIIVTLICIVLSAWLFSISHQLRYLEVRRLRRRLEMIERDQELAYRGLIAFTEGQRKEGEEVCKRLWILTGKPAYRNFMARAERRRNIERLGLGSRPLHSRLSARDNAELARHAGLVVIREQVRRGGDHTARLLAS